MKKIAIYVRVSTQEQATEGYSISEQQERLTKYCEAHGWSVVRIYTDPGFSGSNINRPALQELISDIARKRFDTVLVYKLDRLSRSQKDTLYIIEDVLLKNNIDFISMCENFDTATPFGRAMIGILSVFAQLEREQIKERTSMGIVARSKEGKWHGGGNVPIGYDFVNGELVKNPYEALQVRKVYQLFLNGLNLSDIARSMNGYTTKYGTYKVGYNTIALMLRNPIYIGKIKTKEGYTDGIHEHIIDDETFYSVQEGMKRISKLHEKSTRQNHIGRYLLSGICRCQTCGSNYSVQSEHCAGKVYQYYKCHNRVYAWRTGAPRCQGPNFSRSGLEDIIVKEICRLQTDPGYIDSVAKKPSKSDDEDVFAGRLADIEKRIQRTIRLYSFGTVEDSDIEDQLQLLYAERSKLRQTIEETATDNNLEKAKKALSFQSICDMDYTAKRQLVRLLIDHVEISKNKDITIYWNF